MRINAPSAIAMQSNNVVARIHVHASRGLGTRSSLLARPRLLAPPLLPPSHIPPCRTAARQAKHNEPSEDGSPGTDPHESEHLDAYARANVERCDGREDVPNDDEHDGGEDSSDSRKEGAEESEDHDGQRGPSAEDGNGGDEHHDEVEAETREEEAKHPVRDETDEAQVLVDLCWEGDWRWSVY